jgi:hypothetical protein
MMRIEDVDPDLVKLHLFPFSLREKKQTLVASSTFFFEMRVYPGICIMTMHTAIY